MSAGHGLRLPAEDRIALLSDQDAAGDIESSRSSGGGGVPLPSARADRGRLWWRIQQAAATGARSRSTRGVFSTAAATVVCVAVAVVALVLAISASWRSSGSGLGSPNSTDRNPGAPIYAGIPKTAFDQGLLKCRFIQEFTLNLAHFHHHERQLQQRQGGRVENPRFPINGTHEGSVQPPADWLITHAKLWDGDGVLYEDVDILISKGLVKKVSQPGTRISNNGSDQVLPEIDAQGRFVTPGLV